MTDREPVNIMGVIAFPEPDKSKRRIRFIDAEYNTLFYIPDGASIVIKRMDGSSVIRSCTYINMSKANRLEYDFVIRVAESEFYLQRANA